LRVSNENAEVIVEVNQSGQLDLRQTFATLAKTHNITDMQQVLELDIKDCRLVGSDVRLVAVPKPIESKRKD